MDSDVGEGAAGEGVAEGCLSDECRGGDGGRVDDVCVGLVNRRETEAVAVDVPAAASGGGESREGGGWRSEKDGRGGCSSRILRRALTVCFAGHPSEEDEEDSSMGGIIGGFGVRERERRDSDSPHAAPVRA